MVFLILFLRILEPKNNVVVSPQQIHFVWSETFLAGNYQLQLSFDDIFSSIERDTIVAQGSVNITLAEGKTYYWRVRLKATGYNSNWSSTGVFSTLNPKSIGNILLWYDAQDPSLIIGNAVPIWIDGSPNLNNATQSIINSQPFVANGGALLSNKKVIRFDGVDDYMIFDSRLNNIQSAFFCI